MTTSKSYIGYADKLKRTYVGHRYGKLVVLDVVKHNSYYDFIMDCDCGRKHRTTKNSVLRLKCTRCKICSSVDFHKRNGTWRGEFKKESTAWAGMIARCNNKKFIGYNRYGGRGISVCDRWSKSCSSFIEDMGLAPTKYHSLDRINNDGNYEPSNCRWATIKEQNNNKSSNILITCYGETNNIAQWSEKTGVSRSTIRLRHIAGKSPEDCLVKPKTKNIKIKRFKNLIEMKRCNCIEETEQKVLNHLIKTHPNKHYDGELNHFDDTGFRNTAISFEENGGTKFYHELVIKSSFTKVNGEESKPKRQVINIYPTYCCFCGIKLTED